MSTDGLLALRLAIVATRFASRAAITSQVRRQGVSALDARLESLAPEERGYVDRTACDLLEAGITGVLLGAPDYPATLAALRAAPPALFVRGGPGLLNDPRTGICGSPRTA